MNEIILKIVNAWYDDLCAKQTVLNTAISEIATMLLDAHGDESFFEATEISDESDFKETIETLFPDLVFQLAGGTWFIVKEIK